VKEKIVNLCGEYPENFQKIDIKNDPNFTFVADPSYEGVKLTDIDGNNVIVNSFIECEHYVSGGWDVNILLDNEVALQNYISFIFFGLGTIAFFLLKKYGKI
tara:strand:- start:12808 stop:13113 length:306 start_codon:yes stop_codon:yes gene_type:complete